MTDASELHARVRDVANAVRAKAAVSVPKQDNVHLCWATVTAIATSPPTVELAPGGVTGSSRWEQVSYGAWYHPVVDDIVLVLLDGSDRIVLGIMASTAAGGIKAAVAYAILGPVPVRALPGAYIPSLVHERVYVVGAEGDISAGSIDVEVQVNGVTVPGLATCSLTSTPGVFSCTPYLIATGQKLRGVTSSMVGLGDMSFSIYTVTYG